MTSPPTTAPVAAHAYSFDVPYMVLEVVVAIGAVVGNLLVILAFRRERRLRRRTNYYIVSLAGADFLVGLLGIPCALLASVGLPAQEHLCLFTTSLLVVLCTISIFCLVAVSVDRYWAILHPMGYSRNVRTKTAIGIICACWAAGSFVGFLPLMGWNRISGEMNSCYFEQVMAPQFLVFLYFATIIGPATVMAAFYTHIYTVVLKQLKQMVTVNGTSGSAQGSMLRVLGAARKREVKATQNLSIIVLFFMVCWIPLYTIDFFQAYYPPWQAPLYLTQCCIILSHLNSAGNPLLYAYHLRDFRAALRSLLFGPPPEKAAYRDNAAYQVTPVEQRVKRVSSAGQLGAYTTDSVRGHTVPLYQPPDPPPPETEGRPGVFHISSKHFPVNLSCIVENSQSEDCKSISVLGLQTLDQALTCLSTLQPSSSDSAEPTSGGKESSSAQEESSVIQESPMGFMDDRAHEVYSLGLMPESPANQKPEANLTCEENCAESHSTDVNFTETNCNGLLKDVPKLPQSESAEENRNGCAVPISQGKLDVKMSNEITHL